MVGLDAEVNQDLDEEWQNISIEGTFGGVTIRDMAIAVGMENEYRLHFAPASSATHGEWSLLDRYVLERCQNPLHGGHRIPLATLPAPLGSQLMDAMLGVVAGLVTDYTAAVGGGLLAGGDPKAA